jgi:hypothetical protein
MSFVWIPRGRMQDNRLHINEKFNIKLSCFEIATIVLDRDR